MKYPLNYGIFEDKTIKPTINAILAKNNEFTNALLMLGLNKYYEYEKHDFYFGLLVGEGAQTWEYNPLNGTKNNAYTAWSPVAAFQVGAEYMIQKNLALGLNAKYYLHNYTTNLAPSPSVSSEILHSRSTSVSIGLRYIFGDSSPKQAEVIEQKTQEVVEPIAQVPVVAPVVVPVVVLDADNDGVIDANDICTNTPKDVRVNAQGCPLDSDNDGVLDYKDACVNTPTGFSVDENGCAVALELNIHFESNKSIIKPQYEESIQKFANFLEQFPEYKAKIEAHSDSRGSKNSNLKLSQERAKSVYNALLKHNISADRLSYKGYGESMPIADNKTAEGRAKNRRIEAVLVK